MRLAAAAAVVLFAGCSDPRDCSIDAVEADFAGSAALDDCGDLFSTNNGSPIDMAAYQGAQTCVMDHVQQHTAFLARWEVQFVDSYERGAYAGVMHDGTWTLAAFDEQGGALHGRGAAERDTCMSLVVGSPCSTWITNLCIQCVGRKVADPCEP